MQIDDMSLSAPVRKGAFCFAKKEPFKDGEIKNIFQNDINLGREIDHLLK